MAKWKRARVGLDDVAAVWKLFLPFELSFGNLGTMSSKVSQPSSRTLDVSDESILIAPHQRAADSVQAGSTSSARETKSTNGQSAALVERLVNLSLDIAGPAMIAAPRTRNGQREIAALLQNIFADVPFRIPKEYVQRLLGRTDPGFASQWVSSHNHLAWLLLHEGASDAFGLFAMDLWDIPPRILHLVPKAAGTSVGKALFEHGAFLSYVQTDFEEMARLYGVAGIVAQTMEFLNHGLEYGRLYLAGHFNLPDRIQQFGLPRSVQGVTLTRKPADLVSSALRYVWRMICEEPALMSAYCTVIDRQQIELTQTNILSGNASRETVRSVARSTIQSEPFIAEFGNLLTRHYLNSTIDTPQALKEFLRAHPGVAPVIDVSSDQLILESKLGLRDALPTENASLVSHDALVQVMGSDTLQNLIAPLIEGEDHLYAVLKHRHDELIQKS